MEEIISTRLDDLIQNGLTELVEAKLETVLSTRLAIMVETTLEGSLSSVVNRLVPQTPEPAANIKDIVTQAMDLSLQSVKADLQKLDVIRSELTTLQEQVTELSNDLLAQQTITESLADDVARLEKGHRSSTLVAKNQFNKPPHPTRITRSSSQTRETPQPKPSFK